jgi:cellulose synthase/poly-beta-1,6-N-acetylglucosamine synthase-like glycosyltransferase
MPTALVTGSGTLLGSASVQDFVREQHQIGDHRWWIGDLERFRRDYPGWDITYDIDAPLREIHDHNVELWLSMKLSGLVPAHNEVESITDTVTSTATELQLAPIDYEIIVVDDASSDGTAAAISVIADRNPRVRCSRSHLRLDSATRFVPGSTSTPGLP